MTQAFVEASYEEESIDNIVKQELDVVQGFTLFLKERDQIMASIMNGNEIGSLSTSWQLLQALRPIFGSKKTNTQNQFHLRTVRLNFYSSENQHLIGETRLHKLLKDHLVELSDSYPKETPDISLCKTVFASVAKIIVNMYQEFWRQRCKKADAYPKSEADILSKDEMAAILEVYGRCLFTNDTLKKLFNQQIAACNALNSEWLRPDLRDGLSPGRAAKAIVRRGYHVTTIFDLMIPSEEEISQYKSMQTMDDRIRKLCMHTTI